MFTGIIENIGRVLELRKEQDNLHLTIQSEISDELMDELNGIAERITTNIDWKKGDILMIDNTRIMHGRRAFKDETREIYIRLCSPNFQF